MSKEKNPTCREEKKKAPIIQLLLHHDYLRIVHDGKRLYLPVRCAKIIHDMYEIRGAKNESEDLKKYSNEGHNPEYDVSVFNMSAGWNNCLQWIHQKIESFKEDD